MGTSFLNALEKIRKEFWFWCKIWHSGGVQPNQKTDELAHYCQILQTENSLLVITCLLISSSTKIITYQEEEEEFLFLPLDLISFLTFFCTSFDPRTGTQPNGATSGMGLHVPEFVVSKKDSLITSSILMHVFLKKNCNHTFTFCKLFCVWDVGLIIYSQLLICIKH